jgi:hypothetical protein
MSNSIIVGSDFLPKDVEKVQKLISSFVQKNNVDFIATGMNSKKFTTVEIESYFYANSKDLCLFDVVAQRSKEKLLSFLKTNTILMFEKISKFDGPKHLLIIHHGNIKPFKRFIRLAKINSYNIEIKEI